MRWVRGAAATGATAVVIDAAAGLPPASSGAAGSRLEPALLRARTLGIRHPVRGLRSDLGAFRLRPVALLAERARILLENLDGAVAGQGARGGERRLPGLELPYGRRAVGRRDRPAAPVGMDRHVRHGRGLPVAAAAPTPGRRSERNFSAV